MAKRIVDGDKLTELWNKGISCIEISKATGWKVDTIYKYAHRLGFYKRKRGPQSLFEKEPDKQKWFTRNYPEMSNDTISVYLGISPDRISKLARLLGLRKSEKFLEDIKEYRKKRVREYHASRKGDKEYYAYNKRPRKNGKFIKTDKNDNLY